MSLLAFCIGLGLPTVAGWLLLRIAEGSAPVLLRTERWLAGFVLGPTLVFWLVFVLHVTVGLPLSRWGFLGVEGVVLLLLAAAWYRRTPTGTAPEPPSQPRWKYEPLLWALLALAIVKVLLAGTTFLLLTPTYVDDALDNWNLRGKMFYEDRALTLAMPGEDPILSQKGISSYPPTVPLLKASLAAIAGRWSESLINGVHLLWFAAGAGLLFSIARRMLGRSWGLLAAYAYLAMPLATMHGTNPYADIFVSLHVFLTVGFLLSALREQDTARRRSWFLLLGIACAALSFTKNEGIILYLPPILLILGIALLLRLRTHIQSFASVLRSFAFILIPLAAVALPWLLFKWSHGLTFGNAKPVGSFAIYWRENVLQSVGVNTFLEGNWLFLIPLLLGLLAWRWRAAWRTNLPLTAFVAIVYCGQLMIFLFTDLAAEALMQTGYARGLVQLLPCLVLLTTLLLADAWKAVFLNPWQATAPSSETTRN